MPFEQDVPDPMKTKWDVDFSFRVGNVEVHSIDFHWAQGPAEAVVNVDGVETLRERHPFGMKSLRRYELTVGRDEIHTVLIEKRKPFAWGGVRQQTFRVYVDGQLSAEH